MASAQAHRELQLLHIFSCCFASAQVNGGELISDGTRNRTLGGIFWQRLRSEFPGTQPRALSENSQSALPRQVLHVACCMCRMLRTNRWLTRRQEVSDDVFRQITKYSKKEKKVARNGKKKP